MEIKEVFSLARVPSILMLGLLYVVYVLIGGVVFWKLEGDLVQRDINVLLLNKQRLLTTYTCLNQGGLEEVAQVSSPRSPLLSTSSKCCCAPLRAHSKRDAMCFASHNCLNGATNQTQLTVHQLLTIRQNSVGRNLNRDNSRWRLSAWT